MGASVREKEKEKKNERRVCKSRKCGFFGVVNWTLSMSMNSVNFRVEQRE